MKDKNSAGLLALFLGGIGGHKFYLERTGLGILYLVFCWTLIPALVSIVEAIVFFSMSKAAFDFKYNAVYLATFSAAQPQNIVVNVTNSASAAPAAMDVSGRIKSLHDLKVAGAISEEEFTDQKRRLLSEAKL